jgi:low temperature requirement protein LtrA
MYNHYKDYKDELKLEVNQKHLCSNVVLLMILSLCFGNSTLRVIIENYESFSTTKKMIVSFFIFFDLLALFMA